MQLALVNNNRVEAFEGGRGNCPICGAVTIAKCGPKIINHWAHFRLRDCDSWWENETQWHRDWKNNFPSECREVSHVASDGEIHRADVKTSTGIIIELQHSPMSDKERISREEFYKNLVWIIDGSQFEKNFDIYHELPNPKSELAKELIWFKAKRNYHGANSGIFFKLNEVQEEYPGITKATLSERKIGGLMHFMHEIEDELLKNYNGYHQFDWVKPRSTWLEAKCPVYIDFGGSLLVKLETYDETGLKCVRYISKNTFMYDVMHEKHVEKIAQQWKNVTDWAETQNFNFDK
ncbi:CoiA-like domain protein [Acinetobacter pittii]|uniref:competence protein CoiA n=1 Tax=Acinetobacter pittii TaxID=48296 RepID=UPI00083837AE|nr:CoiA-like domain protein [Acinetobacter pittii]OCY72712.1 CoiA-like domain protein [Acinetobacter pittii]OCY75031.1 CoiA-like domain protein [Acinetobacter pittii]OCY85353.1 CoiA-like domain protein [Acinetobacter pittii]